MTSKKCTKCNILKPLSKFYKDHTMKDGHLNLCIECRKTQRLTHRRTKVGIATSIYNKQLSKSRERGHPKPSYTLLELRAWLFSQDKFTILFTNWKNSNYETYLKPSIDRVDDYKPYTFDNIKLLTWKENWSKANSDKINCVNNKVNKTVIQMTPCGKFIKRYFSIASAGRKSKIGYRLISDCCNQRRKTTGGFRWMFEIVI